MGPLLLYHAFLTFFSFFVAFLFANVLSSLARFRSHNISLHLKDSASFDAILKSIASRLWGSIQKTSRNSFILWAESNLDHYVIGCSTFLAPEEWTLARLRDERDAYHSSANTESLTFTSHFSTNCFAKSTPTVLSLLVSSSDPGVSKFYSNMRPNDGLAFALLALLSNHATLGLAQYVTTVTISINDNPFCTPVSGVGVSGSGVGGTGGAGSASGGGAGISNGSNNGTSSIPKGRQD